MLSWTVYQKLYKKNYTKEEIVKIENSFQENKVIPALRIKTQQLNKCGSAGGKKRKRAHHQNSSQQN